jgi:hypothetical protein
VPVNSIRRYADTRRQVRACSNGCCKESEEVNDGANGGTWWETLVLLMSKRQTGRFATVMSVARSTRYWSCNDGSTTCHSTYLRLLASTYRYNEIRSTDRLTHSVRSAGPA